MFFGRVLHQIDSHQIYSKIARHKYPLRVIPRLAFSSVDTFLNSDTFKLVADVSPASKVRGRYLLVVLMYVSYIQMIFLKHY